MSNKKCVGNCIKNGSKTIHPFNLNIIENLNNNEICPTKTTYDKKTKALSDISEKCDKITSDEIINYMNKPYVYIDHSYLIEEVFEINDIDDIKLWMDKNMSKPTRFICRVLNIWIKSNLKDLKKYQQLLIKLVGDISIAKNLIKKKDQDKFVKLALPNFIKSWINKVDDKYFYFDIFYDLEKFLGN